jgi:hypothetical protein
MVRFELILVCPLHPKSLVFFQIDAKDEYEAVGKAIGEKAICEYPRRHSFIIHAENIIGWQPLTPTYMPAELAEREVRRPPAYVPPPPPEKLYYVEPKVRLEKLRRKEWWKT